jgi:hypothetical protein
MAKTKSKKITITLKRTTDLAILKAVYRNLNAVKSALDKGKVRKTTHLIDYLENAIEATGDLIYYMEEG